MGLPAFSIRRPVTILMVYAGILLLGTISWFRLPQELFPPITYPQLSVVTRYENAAPEEIESLITKIVEEAVGTAQNSRRVSSLSREGLSLVTVEFNWGTNMDIASLNVREKIDLIKERLPRDAKEPIVVKYNPFELPVMVLSVTGDVPPNELLEITRKVIKDEIEKLEGVAAANISGGLEREIQVEINEAKLEASKIPLTDVVRAIANANLNFPAGTIKESFYEFLIRTIGEFQKVSEIENIVVKVAEPPSQKEPEEVMRKARGLEPLNAAEMGRSIRIKDIAAVRNTLKERASFSRFNGTENVTISVQKQALANTIKVASSVRKVLHNLGPTLSRRGVAVDIVSDNSRFIEESIQGLVSDSIEGSFLALLVLFLFLGDFWSSLLITSLIPIAVWMTFAMMFFFNLSVNLMSLFGLALGVGMLVDVGVVVIENIYQHRQAGEPPKEATVNGTEEVMSALWGSQLTSIAVFLPLVFVIGIAGQLFKELALTISFSQIAALFVAITLIPVFAGRMRPSAGNPFARQEEEVDQTGGIPRILQRWTVWFTRFLEKVYEATLRRVLANRGFYLSLTLALFVASMALLLTRDKEFMPSLDQGQFIIKLDLPAGTKLTVTDRVAREAESLMIDLPELENVTAQVGSNPEVTSEKVETLGSHQVQLVVNLKKERHRSVNEILASVKASMEVLDLEGAKVEYIIPGSIFASGLELGEAVALEVRGHDLQTLESLANQLVRSLSSLEGFYGVKTSQSEPSPETKVQVVKDRAALHNLSVTTIAQMAQIAIKGAVATKFKEGGREIDVRVRLREEDRRDFSKLRRIPIQTPLNQVVPLSEVAYVIQGKGPSEIRRLEQQRVIFVTANLTNRSFSSAAKEIQVVVGRLKVPPSYSVILVGEQERLRESFPSLIFALVLAIVLVYMIMAAEFESLWQPFIIMFTVPLAVIGVAFSLLLSGTTLNTMVLVGINLLGGVVVNNAIVLFEFLNPLMREKGMAVEEAFVEAGKRRLRPILMTALTSIAGVLPLAFSSGKGGEIRRPMAITMMGGMMLSTILTLVVIPALYISFQEWFGRARDMLAFFLPAFRRVEAVPAVIAPSVSVVSPGMAPTVTMPAPLLPPISLFNSRQEEALAYVKRVGYITRKEYAEQFRVSIPTAARDLRDLIEKGYLRGVGPLGPGRRYEPTGK